MQEGRKGCSFQTLFSLNNAHSPCCQLTVYSVQYSVIAERWFFSNAISLNNAHSPQPPDPLPRRGRGKYVEATAPAPCQLSTATSRKFRYNPRKTDKTPQNPLSENTRKNAAFPITAANFEVYKIISRFFQRLVDIIVKFW